MYLFFNLIKRNKKERSEQELLNKQDQVEIKHIENGVEIKTEIDPSV
jgi:hypothetical protein